MSAKSALSRLAAFSKAAGLLTPSDSVLAAVSGGADSVCLAHWLAGRRAKGRIRALRLVHFHHGLRGKVADKDADFVRALAARLEMPCEVVRLNVIKTSKHRKAGRDELVQGARLDDVDLPARIDVLKIDVEGSEWLALRGAQATIERTRPTIFSELWIWSPFSARDLHSIVQPRVNAAGNQASTIACFPLKSDS